MADLIDRQAAIEALESHCEKTVEHSALDYSIHLLCNILPHLFDEGYKMAYRDACDVIINLPSAEPNYCRNCKWSKCHINVDKHGKTEMYWHCLNWDGGTDEEGYCHEWEGRTDG